MSCQTSPEVIEKTAPPPPIEWPTPPDPQGYIEVSEDGETVYVDTELWVQIAEYMVDVQAVKEKYQAFRDIYAEK